MTTMKIVNDIPPFIDKNKLVSMDVEMYGQVKEKLHRPTGTFACLSICIEGSTTVYQIYDEKQIPAVLEAVKGGVWVFHNALYDLRQLMRYAKIRPRYIHDTMLFEQAVYGGYYQNFSLSDLTRRWLGIRMDKEARSAFETETSMTKETKEYAANDALRTLEIAFKQVSMFGYSKEVAAYHKIDEPMIFPLLDMQGMAVDQSGWKVMVTSFEEKGRELEAELGFNVYSQKQVLIALAKSGLHLTDTRKETLDEYKANPIVSKVLEARMYRKASSTYGMKWIEKNVEEDGKVYSSYHITGAETGRMSSSSPNMQQIPARKLPEYRKMFKAEPNHVLIVADVSQQEPCILAYESQDAELLKVLRAGESTHLAVARRIFHDDKLTKNDTEKYFVGKTINLGTAYGLSEYGLALRLGITEQEAAVFLEEYFRHFPDVKLWIGKQRNDAYREGYITTASGRRVYINPYDHQWMNNAINAPIQGGAADFTKMWIRKIWEACRKQKVEFPLVAIVHDELVLHVLRSDAKMYKALLQSAFDDTAAQLFPGVPFKVDIEMGKSWACKSMKEELLFLEDEETNE
jgi:DNA polymerase-1